MIFYFSCVSKERRDAYFVSDKVLLQSKNYYEELSSIRIKGGERERERGDTDTKETEKATHKKKEVQIRSLVLFFHSYLFYFILFFFLSAIASHQARFFLLTIFISALVYSSILFFFFGISGGFPLFLNLDAYFLFYLLNLQAILKIRSNS